MSIENNQMIRDISEEGKRALAALPRDEIRSKYRFETHNDVAISGERGAWRGSEVKIYRQGEQEPLHSCIRNYPSIIKTYDVFRWWHSDLGVWRDYAVVSPNYLGFEIIDLETGAKVAETAKEDKHTWSFCPAEFYIPDFWDIEIISELEDEMAKGEEGDLSYFEECMTAFIQKRSFGFVSGTVWGDDWSWKLAQLDLRQLLEGEAAIVEKFGYYPLPRGVSLRAAVGFGEDGESEYFTDMENDNLDLATFNTIRLRPDGSLGETFIHATLPEELERLRAEREKEKKDNN